MTGLTGTAYAKINLALHVRTRRSDGYHDLDTLFAFLDVGDEIDIEVADSLSLHITGPFAAGLSNGPDNLVLRAAEALQRRYGIQRGVAITLDKRLPIASGIGGGSADAAATARLLNDFWEIGASKEELAELMVPLGADIPACIASVTVRGQGTGTDLMPVAAQELSGMAVLLVNPRKPLSTGPVFAAWDGIDRGALAEGSVLDAAYTGRNDLQDAAITLCPEIGYILSSLAQMSPILTRMSGSGATCFALFDSRTARDLAQAKIQNEHPAWWTMAGRLR